MKIKKLRIYPKRALEDGAFEASVNFFDNEGNLVDVDSETGSSPIGGDNDPAAPVDFNDPDVKASVNSIIEEQLVDPDSSISTMISSMVELRLQEVDYGTPVVVSASPPTNTDSVWIDTREV